MTTASDLREYESRLGAPRTIEELRRVVVRDCRQIHPPKRLREIIAELSTEETKC